MKTLALLALLSSLTIATDTEGYIRFYNLPGYESSADASGQMTEPLEPEPDNKGDDLPF